MSGSIWCYLLAGILLVRGLVALATPELTARSLRAFPRHKLTGYILSALVWIWATAVLYVDPIDFLAPVQRFVPIIGLACIPLSWFCLDNLLPCRAWAGAMMLFPMPLIVACRDYESAWRILPIALAYVALTAGMIVMFYPWTQRDAYTKLATSHVAIRVVGGICVLLGALLIFAGTQLTAFVLYSY